MEGTVKADAWRTPEDVRVEVMADEPFYVSCRERVAHMCHGTAAFQKTVVLLSEAMEGRWRVEASRVDERSGTLRGVM